SLMKSAPTTDRLKRSVLQVMSTITRHSPLSPNTYSIPATGCSNKYAFLGLASHLPNPTFNQSVARWLPAVRIRTLRIYGSGMRCDGCMEGEARAVAQSWTRAGADGAGQGTVSGKALQPAD